jgi:hypothetical protein
MVRVAVAHPTSIPTYQVTTHAPMTRETVGVEVLEIHIATRTQRHLEEATETIRLVEVTEIWTAQLHRETRTANVMHTVATTDPDVRAVEVQNTTTTGEQGCRTARRTFTRDRIANKIHMADTTVSDVREAELSNTTTIAEKSHRNARRTLTYRSTTNRIHLTDTTLPGVPEAGVLNTTTIGEQGHRSAGKTLTYRSTREMSSQQIFEGLCKVATIITTWDLWPWREHSHHEELIPRSEIHLAQSRSENRYYYKNCKPTSNSLF